MISNKYLNDLYNCSDENHALNELLNRLTLMSEAFVSMIQTEIPNIDILTEEERVFLTKASALIEHFFLLKKIDIPDWLEDDRLKLQDPFVFGAREKDIWFLKTILKSPTVFKEKNVYFDLDSLIRI